jgi:transposase InsO family protein
MGAAQIRAQLKRFKGWRLAVRAIDRVLRSHGYEPVHRGSRPQGPEPIRFEAPRPNALWQIDYAEVRVGPDRLHIVVVLDDFSRFVVGHDLCESPSAESAIDVVRQAIARHGKPEAIRTDRGGGFLSKEFADFLESELIDHVVGRAYSPQGGGKVEALIGTIRRELWDVEHFDDRAHAIRRLSEFLEAYNVARAHMGIDGVTPADRYFGRADRVLALVDAISRRRQILPGRAGHGGGPIEELTGSSGTSPLEVLRLVLVGDELELRFCGARFRLGRATR